MANISEGVAQPKTVGGNIKWYGPCGKYEGISKGSWENGMNR